MKTYFFQTALLPSLPLACARAAGDRDGSTCDIISTKWPRSGALARLRSRSAAFESLQIQCVDYHKDYQMDDQLLGQVSDFKFTTMCIIVDRFVCLVPSFHSVFEMYTLD